MKAFLSLLVFLVCGIAHAGFIAEPFLGYESNTIKGKAIGTTTESKSTASGLAYGLKLGYSFGQFWLGADYKGSAGSDKSDSATTDYTTAAIGALVGYQVNKFNFWAGYGFSDTLTFKTNPKLDLVGTNFKFGFNYQTPQKFNVGVEVAIPKYTKASTSVGEIDIDQVYSNFDVTSVMFMVSYPFGGK